MMYMLYGMETFITTIIRKLFNLITKILGLPFTISESGAYSLTISESGVWHFTVTESGDYVFTLTADEDAPTVVSAEVGNVDALTIDILFSNDISDIDASPSSFEITASGGAVSIDTVAAVPGIFDDNSLHCLLVLDREIVEGETISMVYTPSQSYENLQGFNGVEILAFEIDVTNNI